MSLGHERERTRRRLWWRILVLKVCYGLMVLGGLGHEDKVKCREEIWALKEELKSA